MKPGSRLVLAVLLVSVSGQAAAAGAGGLPVDEDAIVAEMDALVETTPDLDAKGRGIVRDLTQKGIKAHDAKQFDKAVDLYRRALAVGPLADQVYYELAYTYSSMGDQPAALDAVIRALALNPKVEIYYVLKANVLDDLGFRDQALEAYRRLLEIEPASYLGRLNLGISLIRSGETERAEAELLRAIEIKPDHPSGYFHMASLCKISGHDYDEQVYLEKFLEHGAKDPRSKGVKERLEELRHYEVLLDAEHPYPEIDLIEKMTRVIWKTERHKNAFPEARGYELTFEEDKDIYSTILAQWRDTKRENPKAAHGPYDLLLRIDDAGFLDEYVWYHRQRVFGDRASSWIAAHGDRMEAFVGWARAQGLLGEQRPSPTLLERCRALPASLFEVVEGSKLVYEIGSDAARPNGLLEDDRRRFSRGLKLGVKDRIDCRKASRSFDRQMPDAGAAALVPMLRCFRPGEPGYEHAVRRASRLGLETREVEFRPAVDLAFGGETIRVDTDPAWLFYALAKAAWRMEPDLRRRHGGAEDARASLEEEIYALAVAAGAYANAREPEAPEEPAEPAEDDEARHDEPAPAPFEPNPVLERLVEAIEAGHFRGYVLYEVVHKAYGIRLDRLEDADAEAVRDYLYGHAIVGARPPGR